MPRPWQDPEQTVDTVGLMALYSASVRQISIPQFFLHHGKIFQTFWVWLMLPRVTAEDLMLCFVTMTTDDLYPQQSQ